MFNRLYQRLVVRHWRAVDTEYLGQSTGPRTAEYKAIVCVVVSGIVLTCMQYIVLRGNLQQSFSGQVPEFVSTYISKGFGAILVEYRSLLRNVAWSLGCGFFYFIVPAAVVKLLFRESLLDWGLSPRGYFRHLWIYVLLFIPVACAVAAVSFSKGFQQNYPFYKNPYGLSDFLVWECFYALQFCALEFFFRGFMLRGLAEKFGSGAILFMIIPYCMIHFQKPMLETLGAIIAGLILGILALRTRSVWGGATIHVAVAVSMDVAVIFHAGGFPT